MGTGKYRDLDETGHAIEASGADVVTMAVRRTNLGQNPNEPNLLDVISPIVIRYYRILQGATRPMMPCEPVGLHANCWMAITL